MHIQISTCSGCNKPMQLIPEYLPNEYVFTCPECIEAVLKNHNNNIPEAIYVTDNQKGKDMKCASCNHDLVVANGSALKCINPQCPPVQYHLLMGKKYDQGKLRYDLLPTDSLKELVKVFTYGVEKYDDRNWEKGMEWGRIYGAIQRHLNAFWSGEEINQEDGKLSHLAQAAWGCLILESYRLRKIGTDTRERNANSTET